MDDAVLARVRDERVSSRVYGDGIGSGGQGMGRRNHSRSDRMARIGMCAPMCEPATEIRGITRQNALTPIVYGSEG
jgi:hypothetical protein